MREMEEKMNKHEFNLSGHLWGINRSHKIYLKHFADEVGITLGQYPYLVALSYDDNLNQDDIAKLFQIDKCGVSRALKKLEAQGLIERTPDPNNRRSNILTLTEKGRKAGKYIKDKDDEWEEFIYENIGIDKEIIQEYVRKILFESAELVEQYKEDNCKK